MFNVFRGCGAALCLLIGSSVSQASIILSLSAPGADLADIHVGEMVSFDVMLTGIPSEGLSSLSAEVDFNSAVFGTPSAIAGGAILPYPDPTDNGFAPLSFPGSAQGGYDTFFAPATTPITSDGVFFSFTVTALNAGSGSFSFSPAGTAAFDTNGFQVADFTLSAPPTIAVLDDNVPAVPEPSSFVLFGLGVAGLAARARGRRQRIVPRSIRPESTQLRAQLSIPGLHGN
jgi:hypothetical protein